MPLHADFKKIYGNMVKQYGAKKGKSIFYAYVNKHKLDDTKPYPKKEESNWDWAWESEFANGQLDVKESDFDECFSGNLNKLAIDNENFRNVIYTDDLVQITLMSVPSAEDIGMESHKGVEQTLYFVKGSCLAEVAGDRWHVKEGDVVVVPPDTMHNFTNIGEKDLKLYTTYTPPEHPAGTVHKTKADALKDESKDNESIIRESTVSESKVLEKYKLPDNLQMYKFKAFVAYPTISKNNRKYTEEVLRVAAPGWIDKPFIIDHDSDNGAEKTIGIIQNSYYGTDSLGPGFPERTGLWMKGNGVITKELFIKMHGIGPVPPMVKGVSLGAGGTANLNPNRIGRDGRPGEDMLTLVPGEMSLTPFPGIEGAQHVVEPIEFQEKLKEAYMVYESVKESVLSDKPAQVDKIRVFNDLVLEVESRMSLGSEIASVKTVQTTNDNSKINIGENKMANETQPTVNEVPSTKTQEQIVGPKKPDIKEEIAYPVREAAFPIPPTSQPQPVTPALGTDGHSPETPTPPIQKAPEGAATGGTGTEAPAATVPTVIAPNTTAATPTPPPPTVQGNDTTTTTPSTGVGPLEEYLDEDIEALVDEFIPEYTLELVADEATGKKKWIQKAHIKKGALHAQMGVPAGQKIPLSRLQAAAKKGGTLGRRARLALTFRGMRKSKESTDDVIFNLVKGNDSLKEKLAALLIAEYVHPEPDADDDGGPSDNDKDDKDKKKAKEEMTSGTSGLAMAQGPPYQKKDKKEASPDVPPANGVPQDGALGAPATKPTDSDSTGKTLTPDSGGAAGNTAAPPTKAPNPSQQGTPPDGEGPMTKMTPDSGGAAGNTAAPLDKTPQAQEGTTTPKTDEKYTSTTKTVTVDDTTTTCDDGVDKTNSKTVTTTTRTSVSTPEPMPSKTAASESAPANTVLTVAGKQALEPVTEVKEQKPVYTSLREIAEKYVAEMRDTEAANRRLLKEILEGKWPGLSA